MTAEWGIDFIPPPGPIDDYFMPQSNGAGVAVADLDADGRLDLYFLQLAREPDRAANRLYLQREPGKFEDGSTGSGLDISGVCTGVAVGDATNDGLPEVCVTLYGGVKLFHNLGSGKFADVTEQAGLLNPLWGTSATFFDYDRDGWLDLCLANYVDYDPTYPCKTAYGERDYCAPHSFAGTVSKLFHNLGPQAEEKNPPPRFAEVTLESGLAKREAPALGAVAADFTGDDWCDLLIANDGKPNHLWVNQRNGTFSEEAIERGVAFNLQAEPEGSMGIAYADADGDGLMDVFITHLGHEMHRLWRQDPRGMFLDRTAASGIAGSGMRATGFGTIMEDFDHDGDVDVAVANGRVGKGEPAQAATLGPHWSLYAEPCHLFENDGKGNFTNASARTPDFCGTAGVYRGLASGDLDGDGALDLVVTAVGSPMKVFRNVAGRRGNWLQVRAFDPALKRDAYGAEVTVRAGSKQWVRRIQSDGSYQSANSPVAHFGLGDQQRIETIEVRWPDGSREEFEGGEANHRMELRRGEGAVDED